VYDKHPSILIVVIITCYVELLYINFDVLYLFCSKRFRFLIVFVAYLS